MTEDDLEFVEFITDVLGVFVPEEEMATVTYTDAVPEPHTGDTDEVILATVTIPGGLLKANSVIEIVALWDLLNTNDVVRARIYFGGEMYLDNNMDTPLHSLTTIYCDNSVSAQKGPDFAAISYGPFDAALTRSSVDTTDDVDLVFKGQLVDPADTIILEGYRIKLSGV